MRFLLLPFSWLYGLVMVCRNLAFDWGLLKNSDVGVPVISVGNMTMGGTGKTPLVEYIVRACLARDRRVAVVSRGYRRASNGVVVVSDGQRLLADALQGGDEPVQIARKYRKAIVIVGEHRVEAARKAVHEWKSDVVVLDDGFQHRYVRRDLDIVVLDARKNLNALPLIPAGEKREWMSGLRRASLIAFSRADEVPLDGGWSRRLRSEYAVPTISYRYRLERIVEAGSGREFTPEDLKGKKMLLVSGIGDHQGFVRQMRMAGIDVLDDMKFPDHHTYTRANLKKVTDRMTERGAEGVLTTEKDFVRLSGNMTVFDEFAQRILVCYAGIVVDIFEGREILDSMIERCLEGRGV